MPDCLAGSVLISDCSCPILFTEFDSNAGESSLSVVFAPGQVLLLLCTVSLFPINVHRVLNVSRAPCHKGTKLELDINMWIGYLNITEKGFRPAL